MTHNARFHSLFVGLILAAAAMSPAAQAQTTTQPTAPAQVAPTQAVPAQNIPVVIGILDTEAVVLGSAAGKSLTTQANAQLKLLQDATQKQEDALVAKLKALNPQAPDYATQRQALATADDKLRQDFGTNKVWVGGQDITTTHCMYVDNKVDGYACTLNLKCCIP